MPLSDFTRRDFLKTLGFGAASLMLPGCGRESSKHASRQTNSPNIVLIYTDDQGTLDANCYGSRDLFTPHVDALAKRGIRFTQAYAHTVCCPSRVPLLTGRFPQRAGVNTWTPCHPDRDHPFGKGPNMALDELTLAEVLKQYGYRTALFGKWHLGATPGYTPNEQGFDEFFGHLGGFIDNYTHQFLHGEPFHDLYRNHEEIFEDGKYFPDLVVRESSRFLQKNKDNPFFLFVSLNIPHYPEQADPRFTQMFGDLSMPRRSYAAMISTTDDRIGQIIKKIDELNLRDKTMIIWMSDNGHSTEGYYEDEPPPGNYSANGGGGNTGSWRGAKGSLLEGGIRVPCILCFPGKIQEGETRDQAVMNADFFPTILEMCDISVPDRKIDGMSLWPILKSNKAASFHEVMYWQWENQWAVREGDWKLIVNGRDTTGRHSTHSQRPVKMPSSFLGNLAEDQPEWKNYADIHPDIVERLTQFYYEWDKDVNDI